MKETKLVFFDVETGGLDPARHPIIQFAAVATDAAFQEVEALEVKVLFDSAAAEPEALEKNHYDPVVWKADGVSEAVALSRIADFVRRHATMEFVARMCAFNARFDAEFVAQWFKRAGIFFPGACYEALCSLHLARWASWGDPQPPADHTLSSVCAWLGVPLAAGDAHDGLADVRATVEVTRRLAARMGLRCAGGGNGDHG